MLVISVITLHHAPRTPDCLLNSRQIQDTATIGEFLFLMSGAERRRAARVSWLNIPEKLSDLHDLRSL